MKVCFYFLILLFSCVGSFAADSPNIYLMLIPEQEYCEMEDSRDFLLQDVSSSSFPIFTTNLDWQGILAVLLSGEYSQNNGALDARMPFYPEKQHLVTALNGMGYRSIVFSDSPFFSEYSSFLKRMRGDMLADGSSKIIEDQATFDQPLFIVFDFGSVPDGNCRLAYNETLRFIAEDDSRVLITLIIPEVPSERIRANVEGIEFTSPESIERVRVMDLSAILMNQMGIDLKPSMQGVASRQKNLDEEPVYFRYWSHLNNSVTPAHFGIRTDQERLVFYYGVDFQEKGELADSYEGFLVAVAENQTQPYWLYQRISGGEPLKGNEYENPEYSDRIGALKKRLLALRLEYGEGDRNFPHIQNIIDEHWK